MDIATAIQQLEQEWYQPGDKGFFFDLSEDRFDSAGFERVRSILRAIEIPEMDVFDRRFVEVVWFIPTFMRWQRDGWVMDGRDTTELDEAISFVEQRMTTILGLP